MSERERALTHNNQVFPVRRYFCTCLGFLLNVSPLSHGSKSSFNSEYCNANNNKMICFAQKNKKKRKKTYSSYQSYWQQCHYVTHRHQIYINMLYLLQCQAFCRRKHFMFFKWSKLSNYSSFPLSKSRTLSILN